jgi:DNA-binding CsgD family transcriptional regulator
MGVTTHTVDTYLRRIKAKSGMTTKAELLTHLADIEDTLLLRGSAR